MSDSIYLGKKTKSFDTSPRFQPYDMVVINIDDNQYVSSPRVAVNKTAWISAGLGNGLFTFVYDNGWKRNGSSVSLASYGLSTTYPAVTYAKDGDTITVEQVTETKDGETTVTVIAEMSRAGRCLEADNPFGTVQMADNMLAQIYGVSYQPYQADGALLNPAAEIGDAITAYGVYGGLYSQDLTFGRLMASDIGAPSEEEIDYEYQYKTADQRKYSRKFADIQSEFIIQASEIAARVSKQSPEGQTSFSWQLFDDHFTISSNGTPMLNINAEGSQFTGVIRANQIETGSIIVAGQTIQAGYIQGTQIGSSTISGGNIGSNTVAIGNTTFGASHASDISNLNVRVSNLESTWGSFSGISASNWFTFQGRDVKWGYVSGTECLIRSYD